MSQQAPSESPKPNSTPSRGTQSTGKRKHGEVRIAGATDQFPDVPWYNLDYQHIVSQVNDMLDGVILGLEKYVATDSAIKELVEAAEKAKKLPDLEKCRLAVLGQQAAGKSTLISALLDRTLLETSGGGKACTSVPTAIIHKAGAGDNTRKSDVKIEWLSEEQHPAHILEHIQRWGDVYPGTRSEEQDVSGEQDRDASEAAKSNTKPEKTSPNTLEQIEGAASTAKEFFEIIFVVEHDKDAKTFLEDRLCNTDIRQRDFKDICLEKLSARFLQLAPELCIKDGVSEFLDVHDNDLGKKRRLAKKLWPFVQLFTIATGHVLLRHGICLYDLPGILSPSQG